MPTEPPKPDPIVIVAYLDDVDGELEAARRLSKDPPSRFAAFHLQQAAEKLVKATRLHRGLFASADHNILALVEELPRTTYGAQSCLPLECCLPTRRRFGTRHLRESESPASAARKSSSG